MPVVNYATREIELKIVFYGPPFAGKTTNLKWLQTRLFPEGAGSMLTLRTGADRTLFMEFTPERAVLIEGFKTRFQFYTVPGAVVLNVPRQLVLRDVDGLIFVADSQWERIEQDVISMSNLRENLIRCGHQIDDIPLVLQYNKRDLPNIAPLDYLEFVLNRRTRDWPYLEAVAARGENVFESLETLIDLVIVEFNRRRSPANPNLEHQA